MGCVIEWEEHHQSNKRAYRKEFDAEFEEPDEDEAVEAADLENFVFGDADSAGDPGDGGKEAVDSEGVVEGDVVAKGEAAGVVDAGVGRLFLEDGEEREDDEGET